LAGKIFADVNLPAFLSPPGVLTDGDIDRMDFYASTELLGDLALGLTKTGFSPCREVQMASFGGEGASRGQANALRPTSDQDGLSAKVEIHLRQPPNW
jgi:hypothetical protein